MIRITKWRILQINTVLIILALLSFFIFFTSHSFLSTAQAISERMVVFGATNQEVAITVTQDFHDGHFLLQPKQEQELVFTITNSGDVPVHLKGYLEGKWKDQALDSSVVKVVALRYFFTHSADSWGEITDPALAFNAEFTINSLENSAENIIVQPQEKLQIVARVAIAETIAPEYQNQVFTTRLHIAGKQSNTDSQWPSAY